MTTAEAVERLVRDEPRYVPALRAAIAVAQDSNVANLGTFTARDVRRKLRDWGDGPADYMPPLTHLVTLGLLQRVEQNRKTPQYLMPQREAVVAALESQRVGVRHPEELP
jgi:hypothetical protein